MFPVGYLHVESPIPNQLVVYGDQEVFIRGACFSWTTNENIVHLGGVDLTKSSIEGYKVLYC